jgi:DNA polymerase-3 subunit gamma/tau
MSQPELQADHKILLKTSSDLSKVEMSKELTPLLAYLNKQLNNYKITFEIKVEDRKSEEYVYGVKEKYEYLKKINPEIEVLKKEFDLDL